MIQRKNKKATTL